jgi:hypothetical protein
LHLRNAQSSQFSSLAAGSLINVGGFPSATKAKEIPESYRSVIQPCKTVEAVEVIRIRWPQPAGRFSGQFEVDNPGQVKNNSVSID